MYSDTQVQTQISSAPSTAPEIYKGSSQGGNNHGLIATLLLMECEMKEK